MVETRRVVVIVAGASLALATVLAATPPQARPGEHWVATWGTAQLAFRVPPAGRAGGAAAAGAPPPVQATQPTPSPAPAPVAPPTPASTGPQRRFAVPAALPALSNQTIRMVVRTSLGGQTLRVRLSQAFGTPAVTVGAAHLALRQAESAIVPGSDRPLTFGGKPATMLFGGQTIVSDPVSLSVAPLADLVVSLFLPGEAGPPTNHTFGLRPAYVTGPGDFTAAPSLTSLAGTYQQYAWLTGIDVLAPASAGTLVTFGDSITDGDQSTPDTSQMWPAVLAARLQADRATRSIGVVNAGISGNRVFGDNTGGLARFVRDALDVPGVRWITVLEGINDITGATRPGAQPNAFAADDLIQAYRLMVAAAHHRGIAVMGATLTPYGGSSVFSDRGEAIRQAVNTWIRTGGAFDAVIDFDAATRDPNAPVRFRAEADSPDLLHPGDAGYRLMANAIDLRMFTR